VKRREPGERRATLGRYGENSQNPEEVALTRTHKQDYTKMSQSLTEVIIPITYGTKGLKTGRPD